MLYPVRHQHVDRIPEIVEWCESNCTGSWFNGMDWSQPNWPVQTRIVEFADQRDAVLFALVWT